MGKNGGYSYLYSRKNTVNRVKEQVHLMEILKKMEKQGITGKTALRILSSSRNQKKINEYIKYFHCISYNRQLEQCSGMGINEILRLCYKGGKKEMLMQAVIYHYLEQKGVQSPKVNGIGRKIKKMYKSRGKDRIDRKLRTNMEDIFALAASDYK